MNPTDAILSTTSTHSYASYVRLHILELYYPPCDETISNNREPVASGYSRLDAGLRSSYSQLGSSSYSSSSVALQPYNGYESILS
ncbi:hypothetical protein Lal_00025525 [Lupinus albus]|nr:hypothetical protein Lal_00025525 [Lupinus albus]